MKSKYSKSQWLILFVYCGINLLSAVTLSLQGPFYPMIAEQKGATPSQHGIVFAVFYLVVFILSPFTGILINRFGAVTTSFSGLLALGLANTMFGFVSYLNGIRCFLGTSIAIRVLEAVGYTMFRNAGIAIVSWEFSENVEMVFGFIQAFYCTGHILGPVIGGTLYEWGGFILPFTLFGALLLCSAVIILFLPKNYHIRENISIKVFFKFLQLHSVIIGVLTIVGTFICMGLLLSTLEPHLRNLNLSPVEVGSFFLCYAIALTFSCLIWGKLCEKYDTPLLICIISSIIIVCGLALLGPAPYLFIDLSIYTSIFALMTLGIGAGGKQIAGFSLLNKGATLANFPQNIETYGMLSSIFTSGSTVGIFVGSFLGGYLFDTFQLAWGSHFFILYYLCFCVGAIFYIRFHRENNEVDLKLSSIRKINEETTGI